MPLFKHIQRATQIFCLVIATLIPQLNAETVSSDYKGPKEQLHIYLLIGQSNMAGRAPFSKAEAEPIERCHLLNAEHTWEAASNPLNRYSTIRKDMGQHMNPGYMFSKIMLARDQKIHLGLVVNAKGGTSINLWKKDSQFYKEALKRTKAACETGVLKGILWHQGESDAQDPAYLEKLSALILALRTDLNSPNLPFIAGEIFYHPETKAGTKAFNDVITTLPEKVPHTACVSAAELTTKDNTHFDSKSILILGQRYAEAMLKLQETKKRN